MFRSDAAGAVGWRRGRQGADPRRTPTTPPDDPCSVDPRDGNHDEALITALAVAGLRPTRMRIGVLGLARDARVLTPELVLRRLPDIRPGSIYRVLAECHGKGLLKRYLMRNGRCLYTAIDLAHGVVILHCSGCGHACCLDSPEIARRLDRVAASCGYMIERGLLELGACRRCNDASHSTSSTGASPCVASNVPRSSLP